MKRILICTMLLLAGSLAHAAALTVTIWKPIPGRAADMMEDAAAAKAIHEKLGASVTLGVENTGRLHYAIGGFENWQAWAAWLTKLQASTEWAEWQARTGANPAALQEENFILNVIPGTADPVGGDNPGSVYQVFIWDPPGTQVDRLVEAAMEAKAIHEKSGITVGINIDQMQRMHYVMNYRDWAHWAKVQDTPNEEFQAFMQRQAADPAGELVEVYTANRVP
ncbi:MAG: hypothetical protein P8Y69_07095 [Gammaproteobacteria bacterium]|jgi:hypothetical protein